MRGHETCHICGRATEGNWEPHCTCHEEMTRYREALEKLARLGNEPHYGNSIGNRVAQEALGIEVGIDA